MNIALKCLKRGWEPRESTYIYLFHYGIYGNNDVYNAIIAKQGRPSIAYIGRPALSCNGIPDDVVGLIGAVADECLIEFYDTRL
jgi:hypothetical protein